MPMFDVCALKCKLHIDGINGNSSDGSSAQVQVMLSWAALHDRIVMQWALKLDTKGQAAGEMTDLLGLRQERAGGQPLCSDN